MLAVLLIEMGDITDLLIYVIKRNTYKEWDAEVNGKSWCG
jgi:hypothetical protein